MTMTIGEAVTALSNAKTAIANAITAKGGTVNAGDGFADFPTDIATIPTKTVEALNVTANGTYTAPSGKAYTPVTVNVLTQNPVEVSTATAMDALITAANVGKVYKYTGATTGAYTQGRLYTVEA